MIRHPQASRANQGWTFRLVPRPDDEVPSATGEGWVDVRLPHSWNARDTMETDADRHYRRGVGWYLKQVPSPAAGRRLFLEIEAASQTARAWLDGRPIGGHQGGYTAFTLELTAAGAQAGQRLLALRVDNLPDPDLIPSDLSDFFLCGGLTREAWLYQTGAARIAWVRADTDLTAQAATLQVSGRLDRAGPEPVSLEAVLIDPEGAEAGRCSGSAAALEFALPPISLQTPRLWSPDHPNLYTLRVEARLSDAVSDSGVERVGFRSVGFPSGGPFTLNGEPLRLHGTQRHEDWAGMGSAVPDELTDHEMEMMRAAGFNFVRLGHYPQSRATLEACDRLGLVVWEELPWCRGGVGGDGFRHQTRAMLEEMIAEHHDHPSVVFWGLGNELDWSHEHPDWDTDDPVSSDDEIAAFLGELQQLTRALDPGRLTAMRRFEPATAIVDVYSPSIWAGWYPPGPSRRGGARYQDYEAAVDDALARHPRLLHIEWGGDSHLGRHRPDPRADPPASAGSLGDWSESYICDLMEWHLQVQLRSRLPGNAQWVFKDFGTPLRPGNPIPYVNQKGLLDRAGRPKDAYHVFQSYLAADPMCYLVSPTWRVRIGDPEMLQPVRVYSNCPRVTLLVNGASAGERRRDPDAFPAAGLSWEVPLRPGPNLLRAVATAADGRTVSHAITQALVPGPAAPGSALRASSVPILLADGGEGARALVEMVGRAGEPAVTDRRRVSFALDGGGRLLDRLGIVGGSRVVELADGRASIDVALDACPSTLVVSADGVDTVRLLLGAAAGA